MPSYFNYSLSGQRRRRQSGKFILGESEQPNHVEDDSRIFVDLQRISAGRAQGQVGADRADCGNAIRQQEGHPRPQP